MNNELKPCPFCGSEPFISRLTDHGDIVFTIVCSYCQAKRVPALYLEDAIKLWNMRDKHTCHMEKVYLYDEECVDGVKCDECGWSEIHDHDAPLPRYCPECHAQVVEEER